MLPVWEIERRLAEAGELMDPRRLDAVLGLMIGKRILGAERKFAPTESGDKAGHRVHYYLLSDGTEPERTEDTAWMG
jgi:hypothetical protein